MGSIAWLRHQNREGGNIYIRPNGEHNLSLIDDLKKDQVTAMKKAGFTPALVVETSPSNYQAWLKHPETLDKETSTVTARALAKKFGGDLGSADWRHFGRLAGFTNRKSKHQDVVTGLFPFVRVIEASGKQYERGPEFIARAKDYVEREVKKRSESRAKFQGHSTKTVKTIDDFRRDPRYSDDQTRVDQAYAVYALSHGVSAAAVAEALRSRDLSHKGNNRRQEDYVDRTIEKAQSWSLGR
jgi:hypothetical protein